MNYREIDWSKERNGKNKAVFFESEIQKIKDLSNDCVKMGLTIKQSVNLIVNCMSS